MQHSIMHYLCSITLLLNSGVVTLKCENSPAWLKDKYSTAVHVELSYYHTRALLVADITGDV